MKMNTKIRKKPQKVNHSVLYSPVCNEGLPKPKQKGETSLLVFTENGNYASRYSRYPTSFSPFFSCTIRHIFFPYTPTQIFDQTTYSCLGHLNLFSLSLSLLTLYTFPFLTFYLIQILLCFQ